MQMRKATIQNGPPDNAGVIALPPLIYGVAFVFGLAVHFVFPTHFLPQKPALGLGTLFIVVSIAVMLSAIRAFHRAKTTHDVRKPSTAIVTEGPLRFTRNPIYLSMTLLYLGLASLINSLWILLLGLPLVVVIQWGVINREERYLERKFGEEYRRYKTQVRRWI